MAMRNSTSTQNHRDSSSEETKNFKAKSRISDLKSSALNATNITAPVLSYRFAKVIENTFSESGPHAS